jgi:hypothetical protein
MSLISQALPTPAATPAPASPSRAADFIESNVGGLTENQNAFFIAAPEGECEGLAIDIKQYLSDAIGFATLQSKTNPDFSVEKFFEDLAGELVTKYQASEYDAKYGRNGVVAIPSAIATVLEFLTQQASEKEDGSLPHQLLQTVISQGQS